MRLLRRLARRSAVGLAVGSGAVGDACEIRRGKRTAGTGIFGRLIRKVPRAVGEFAVEAMVVDGLIRVVEMQFRAAEHRTGHF